MNQPFVGLPTEVKTCGYSDDIDLMCCPEAATVHLLVAAPGWGEVALLSCAEHEAAARHAGTVIAEHPPCGDENCLWPLGTP